MNYPFIILSINFKEQNKENNAEHRGERQWLLNVATASPHTLVAKCALNETMIRLINLKRVMTNAVNKMEVWPSAGAVQAELANHPKVLGERFSGIER